VCTLSSRVNPTLATRARNSFLAFMLRCFLHDARHPTTTIVTRNHDYHHHDRDPLPSQAITTITTIPTTTHFPTSGDTAYKDLG